MQQAAQKASRQARSSKLALLLMVGAVSLVVGSWLSQNWRDMAVKLLHSLNPTPAVLVTTPQAAMDSADARRKEVSVSPIGGADARPATDPAAYPTSVAAPVPLPSAWTQGNATAQPTPVWPVQRTTEPTPANKEAGASATRTEPVAAMSSSAKLPPRPSWQIVQLREEGGVLLMDEQSQVKLIRVGEAIFGSSERLLSVDTKKQTMVTTVGTYSAAIGGSR